MSLTLQKENDMFSRKSIRSALKVWNNSKKLGQHPLYRLKIVESQRRADNYSQTPAGYGLALRKVLNKAIEELKPDDEAEPVNLTEDWRSYFVLTERYIKERSQKYIEDRLVISRATFFREQNKAFDRLADLLWRWEQEWQRQQAQGKEPAPPAALGIFLAPPLPDHALIGRDQMLKHLKRRLLEGHSVALFALEGLPGVGKTALAITLAHDEQVREHFKDGVLWIGLGHKPDLMALLSIWGIALGIPASQLGQLTTIKDRARAIHAAIGTREMLLVIDDAWQSQEALTFKLGGPNCAHLLTTRSSEVAFDFADRESQTVQELNEADSLALLYQFVPEVENSAPEEARALVKAVGGLPLALTLMGKYLRKKSYLYGADALRKALEELQKVEQRLRVELSLSPIEQQPSLNDVPLSLLASIEISDNALDEPTREMLRAVSAFPPKPNSFSEEAALTVAAQPAETLKALIKAGLLESRGEDRYTLHQAIADYANLKKNNAEADIYNRRGGDYFANFALKHSGSDGYPLLDADWQNASHFLQSAYSNQQWQTLLDGVEGLTHVNLGVMGFMDARGHWEQAYKLLEQALEGAKALNQSLLEASMLTKLGAFAFRQADFEAAKRHTQESDSILESLPFSAEVALQHAHLCEFMFGLEMQHDSQAALDWVELGLTKLNALPVETDTVTYQKGYLYILSSMILRTTGQLSGAIKAAELGLTLLPSSPTSAQIIGLIILYDVFARLGQVNKAIEYLKQGIPIAQELGDLRRLATLWANIGLAEGTRGNLSSAVDNLQKALLLQQKLGDVNSQASASLNLGMFYIVLGEDEQAFNHLTTAIRLVEMYNLIELEAFAKTHLANLLISLGQLAEATAVLMRAHQICRKLQLTALLPVILYWQAEIARLNREYKKAITLISESLQVASKSGYVLEEGIGWSIKGKILDGMQRFSEAEEAHQNSLQLLAAQDPYDLAQSQLALAQHHLLREGEISAKANSLLENALATFERLGAKREIRIIKGLQEPKT